ncbi:carboxymuconolactone decarboxylase family protein [Amorphus sp. 3PC139-8]|uniref:carboxymuconolactone decarboxylase family protein n=1 Tax=Amorphus sp. 3PC139-8 TaxID=2735676 RepID=UPI00345C85E2
MPDDMPALPEPEVLKARLEELAQARGFLLPHHGALAAGAPDLHAAYLAMYKALTVAPRHLSAFERECVWLAILVAVEEGIGTHHLELFRAAGGTDEMAETLIALTGFADGIDTLSFAQRHWATFLPALDPNAAYARGVAALSGERIEPALVELCLLAVQAARGSEAGIRHHLRQAYALAVAEERIVEALSYLIWPRGVNCFLDACTIWHELMVAGEVTPSPRFAVWAEMKGQGPFDASSGRSVSGFEGGKRDG